MKVLNSSRLGRIPDSNSTWALRNDPHNPRSLDTYTYGTFQLQAGGPAHTNFEDDWSRTDQAHHQHHPNPGVGRCLAMDFSHKSGLGVLVAAHRSTHLPYDGGGRLPTRGTV